MTNQAIINNNWQIPPAGEYVLINYNNSSRVAYFNRLNTEHVGEQLAINLSDKTFQIIIYGELGTKRKVNMDNDNEKTLFENTRELIKARTRTNCNVQ